MKGALTLIRYAFESLVMFVALLWCDVWFLLCGGIVAVVGVVVVVVWCCLMFCG